MEFTEQNEVTKDKFVNSFFFILSEAISKAIDYGSQRVLEL